jgi:AraC-like DNA-binding protein
MATVSVLLLQPVVFALDDAGRRALFGASDLTPEILADSDARVTAAQFCVAWAELVQRRGPEIALAIAEATPPGAFGVVEYVCRSAPTFGAGLSQWARYLNLLDDAVEVGLVTEGDRSSLRVLRESEAPAPASHELCFAVVVLQARRLAKIPVKPIVVEFTHKSAADAAVYRRWFDAPVRFGADHTQLVFARSAMEAPLHSADPQLAAILERHAEELRARADKSPPLTAQVRRLVAPALRSDEATIERVAAQLGLTPRSLQRRLKDEGTTFQTLREDLRRELADRYLHDKLSIAEISFLLGFSEPSAFFRAFKRWTGTTPVEARRRLAEAL